MFYEALGMVSRVGSTIAPVNPEARSTTWWKYLLTMPEVVSELVVSWMTTYNGKYRVYDGDERRNRARG